MIPTFHRWMVIFCLLSSTLFAAAPKISSFTPTSGIVGTSVVLTGTNFTGATAVKFNGIAATSYTVTSATKITAVAPTGVTTGKLSVTTSGGTATSTSNFTVSPPTISSFTPTSGIVGISVVLTGTKFTGATAVKFNGVAASSYTVTSATKITAVAPTGVTSGKLSVTTSGGTATSSGSFTVVAAPTITSFTPTGGTVGTSVVLTGTNFTGATAVKFNGTAASSYTVASGTSITAVVASGTTTGKATVTTPGGTATSSANITIAAPTITSFAAGKSPISTGASTTLTAVFSGGTASIDQGVGSVSSGVAVPISPAISTVYTLTVTGAGGTTTQQTSVSVVPLPMMPSISGPSAATASQAGYQASVAPQAGCTYSWTIANGTITAGSSTASVTFTASGMTPALAVARAEHTATLLNNGKVLVTGGQDASLTVVASVEVYTPGANSVNLGGNAMKAARAAHTATLLPSGKVLLVGGYGGADAPLASAEIYDPATSSFTLVSTSMPTGRAYHTATLLANGKVLIVGGYDQNWNTLGSALLFDPSTSKFTPVTGALIIPRGEHRATMLSSGQVLISGGFDTECLASLEIFDPATSQFTKLQASMGVGKYYHTANLLPNGTVLLAGGYDSNYSPLGNIETFDPNGNTVTPRPIGMLLRRAAQSGVLLPSGQVAFIGGFAIDASDHGASAITAEIFDPVTNTQSMLPGTLSYGREGSTVTTLSSGQVVVAGGHTAPAWDPNNGLDLFDPYSGQFNGSFLMCTVTNQAGDVSRPGVLSFGLCRALSTPVLTIPGTIIEGRSGYQATTQAQSDCTYVWSISNGTITAGAGTPSVVFTAGSAGIPLVITCSVSNTAGTTVAGNKSATIVPSQIILTPSLVSVSPGGQVTISSNQPVTWTRNGFVFVSTTTTSATCKMTDGFSNLNPGTFELTATSKADPFIQSTSYIIVSDGTSPVISTYSAVPLAVHAGQTVTLSWSVSNADMVTLESYGLPDAFNQIPFPDQDVTGQSSVVVRPAMKMSYKLVARKGGTAVYATIVVTPDLIPLPTEFSVAPTSVELGGSALLLATFSNGSGAVEPGGLALQSGVPTSVTPAGSTMYCLKISNQYGAISSPWYRELDVIGPGQFLAPIPMVQNQDWPSATLLRDGRVLLAGGQSQAGSSAQVYIPSSGNTQLVGSMTDGRTNGYTTTLCADGRVLFWGGGVYSDADSMFTYSNTWEIFDPRLNTFSNHGFGSMASYPNSIAIRYGHTATLLADGKVLIAGGASIRDGLNYSYWEGDNDLSLSTVLLFDPNGTGLPVSVANPLGTSRYGHSAIRLADGRVLVAGGYNCIGVSGTHNYTLTQLASAEVFDPLTGLWSSVGDLRDPDHAGHPQLLPDGRVIFSGAEIFDPTSMMFELLPEPESGFARFPSGLKLPDGRFFSGVLPRNTSPLLYDFVTSRWFGVSSPYPAPADSWSSSVLLQDGTVLSLARSFTGQPAPNDTINDHLDHFDPQSRLSISPAQPHTNAGVSLQLQATGPENGSVTWSASGGTVQSDGSFLATTPGLYSVTATTPSGVKASVWVDVHPAVRVIISTGSLPAGAPWLRPGDALQFSAKVLNTPVQSVNWSLVGEAQQAGITSNGTFTANQPGVYIIQAGSQFDPSSFGQCQIQVFPPDLSPPTISNFTISPSTLRGSSQVQVAFAWNVTGAVRQSLSFPGGTASLTGEQAFITSFTPSQMAPGSMLCTLTASNPAGAMSASAYLNVMPVVNLTVTPASTWLYPGQQKLLGFSLSAPTQELTWTATGGTITQAGLFTAPSTPGAYVVTATSVDDPEISASATVTVLPLSLSLDPNSLSLPISGTKQFGYSFTGPSDAVLSWTATAGGVTSTGFYTAPGTAGTYTVTVACPSLKLMASSTITVVSISLSITPTQVALLPGQTQQFGWAVNGGGVTFSVLEPGGGSITQTGLYTAPTLAGVYTIQVTSSLDPTKFAQAKVTVSPIAISIDPPAVTLEAGQSMRFGASLNSGGWTWSATGGAIDDQGRYRAPLLPGQFTVTVQSVFDPSKTATSQVTVVAASTLKLTPNEITMSCGGTIPMTLVGIPDGASVTWSVTNGINGSPGAGAIGPDGVFTAGNTPGSYFITAMESSGGARANAQVQIISHRIIPENGLVGPGQQLQFTAEVFDASPSVIWSIGENNGGTIDTNGLYTAPLQQGQYHVIAKTSQGNLATIPLLVGPPDGFTVAPEVNIQVAGIYEIKLRLKSPSGKTTESLISGDYPIGTINPGITFSQGQLKTDLGEDGPYAIDQVVLNQLVDGELLEVDRKIGIGYTGPYVIVEGDKPWISIGDVEQVIAEDSNSNGLIDTLKVQFTVNVICDGMYTIGGGLVSEDGAEVDSTQAEILLTRGPNVITIPFDGKRIYSCGKSGSYGIKGLTVTGPVMTSRDYPAAITGFSLDQFEH